MPLSSTATPLEMCAVLNEIFDNKRREAGIAINPAIGNSEIAQRYFNGDNIVGITMNIKGESATKSFHKDIKIHQTTILA